jgi:hypothetical protein
MEENLRIENSILRTELVDISELIPFQGKLKSLSGVNFEKLKAGIIRRGFSFTVHIWENAGKKFILDGHQRIAVLTGMRKQGYHIPPITCAFVKAQDFHEAKDLVLLAVSQFGKLDEEGFHEFTANENFDFTVYDFPDLTFDPDEALSEIARTGNAEEVEGTTKMSGEIGVNKEFLVMVFESEAEFEKANRILNNDIRCGYWLSKNKKNPLFFRKGPNRVLSGEVFLKELERLGGKQ